MHEMTRRRFGVIVLGGAGALAVGGATTLRLIAGDGTGVRTFDVRHDPSVYVTMTNGSEFVVEVKRRETGEVIEHHSGVTAYNLLRLRSDHVTFVDAA